MYVHILVNIHIYIYISTYLCVCRSIWLMHYIKSYSMTRKSPNSSKAGAICEIYGALGIFPQRARCLMSELPKMKGLITNIDPK